MVVTLASIEASLFWMVWKLASGRPNWTRSLRQKLTHQVKVGPRRVSEILLQIHYYIRFISLSYIELDEINYILYTRYRERSFFPFFTLNWPPSLFEQGDNFMDAVEGAQDPRTKYRQAIDAHTTGRFQEAERMFNELLVALRGSGSWEPEKIPILIKVTFWLAHSQQMQGRYVEAGQHYRDLRERIITNDLAVNDEQSLWCLTSALTYLAECDAKSSESLATTREKTITDALGWLIRIGKYDEWSAGLHLQLGLFHKERDDLSRACKELKKALEIACEHSEAPGYPLAIYRLELADLLCTIGRPDLYKEAIELARQVWLTADNDIANRRRAYKILIYASLELRKMTARGVQLQGVETEFDAYQLLTPLHIEIEQISNVVNNLSAKVVSIPDEVTRQVHHLDEVVKDFERLIERMNIMMINQAQQSIRDLGTTGAVRHPPGEKRATGTEEEPTGVSGSQQHEQSKHISCLVALPLGKDNPAYETILLPALREVLELDPYYWEVIYTGETIYEETEERNFVAQTRLAHAFVADVSDLNPRVMMELGYICWSKNQQPLILLDHKNITRTLPGIANHIPISYSLATGDNAIESLVTTFKREFRKHNSILMLNSKKKEHYLSKLLLCKTFNQAEDISEMISQFYKTAEAFLRTPVETIIENLPGIRKGVARGLREDIADYFKKKDLIRE